MKNLKPRYEWVKYNYECQYSLIVSCHQRVSLAYGDGPFRWCVYLQYAKDSKVDLNLEDLNYLPLHCGYNYNKRVHISPYKKEHDWQKDSKYIKVGADYNYLNDQHYTNCDPSEGIPQMILNDVEDLDNYVQNLIKGDVDEKN